MSFLGGSLSDIHDLHQTKIRQKTSDLHQFIKKQYIYIEKNTISGKKHVKNGISRDELDEFPAPLPTIHRAPPAERAVAAREPGPAGPERPERPERPLGTWP